MTSSRRKLREFWLIYERPCSPWISNKPLFSADTDEEIHVRALELYKDAVNHDQ